MSTRERGSTLVEFAIVSTALLTLMFGVMDFGRALYTYHLVADAARSGSRFAMVRGSACTVTGCPTTGDAVQTYVRGLAPGVDPNYLIVNTSWSTSDGIPDSTCQGPGCIVAVNVSYQFRFMIPLLPNFPIAMSSTSQMVIAQ